MRRLFALIRYLPPDAVLFVVLRAEQAELEKQEKAKPALAPSQSWRELARSMKKPKKG